MRSVAKLISQRAHHRDMESDEYSPEQYSSGEPPQPENHEEKNNRIDANQAGLDSLLSLQTQVGLDFKSVLYRYYGLLSRVSHSALSPTIVSMLMHGGRNPYMKHLDREPMKMFANHEGIVGFGSNGVVVKSRFAQNELAVKVSIDNCSIGKAALRREIALYQTLKRNKSPLLGTVIPRVYISWNLPDVRSSYAHLMFLLTGFVGLGLCRDKSGTLWVGDRVSGYGAVVREEHMICPSAIHGLRRLRDNSLLHGDVALGNLRAKRLETKEGVFWQTWWVDLGHAK